MMSSHIRYEKRVKQSDKTDDHSFTTHRENIVFINNTTTIIEHEIPIADIVIIAMKNE
jgi:hypothetical protein